MASGERGGGWMFCGEADKTTEKTGKEIKSRVKENERQRRGREAFP